MPGKFKNLQPFLSCKDHLCTGEKFELLYHAEYDLLITFPKPTVEKLPKYYKSNAYISHTDSSKTLFDKIYQWVKSHMLRKKVSLVTKYHENHGTILDIGAGTGDFLKAAETANWNIQGTEPNKKARETAKKKGIVIEQETSILKNTKFDAITMWHVLEHVPNLEKQLAELDRLLKKNGRLFIAVPNFKSYDAKYYKEFWAAYDVPRHLWHFSKTSISKLFGEFNFEIVETIPLLFDAYYVSLLSEDNSPKRKNYLRALLIATWSNVKARGSKEYSSHIYVLKKANS